ncbi:MAG: ATP-binding protein [Lysobacter sp.]|nr:MAG: ATP-binding protein [Lysobacter sp.]
MTPEQPAPPPQDAAALEAQLQAFSRRIDRTLRRHFARHALCRLLRQPESRRERGRKLALWAPSGWLIAVIAAFALTTIASHAVPALLRAFAPGMGGRLAELIPRIDPMWILVLTLVLLVVERFVLPRILLSTHRFRLMRLEHHDGSQIEFPSVYSVARVDEGVTGFGWQSWRYAPTIQVGDIVVSINDRHGRGLAIVPLRTRGRLPVHSWDRDILLHDAFPALPKEIRDLAHEFDRLSDRNAKIADRLERDRKVRTGGGVKAPPADPRAAWASVVLPETVKLHLIGLAAEFAKGGAAATRGLLLYGPPGTGKSLIAKTFASSMHCAFYPLSLPDLKSGYVGQSGERVQALWRKALAEERAVIFIDECEGVFGRRGASSTDSFAEEIVAAFLAQWDGFEKHTHVWVVGATNRRDLIDPAILSRFEDQLEIGLPDGPQRVRILGNELARLNVRDALPPQTELLTQGLSGRELASLAKRLARALANERAQHAGAALNESMLALATADMRRQGSTATEETARWDTLVLSDDTLRELKTTAGLLQHADAFRKRGISVPRGLLLYGPPGTGKTQIARTLANETGLRFIAASTADIKQGFVGQSGQKVRELFERARESAPSLLFIDEIDIVASARGGGNDSFQTEIIGQLLQEMDGAKAQTQAVFVLAATNRLDQLDAALLSRLPKRIEIPLPDRDGAQRILRILLDRKPVGFDLDEGCRGLAARADGRSGRDLRNWVESAEHRAVARAIEAGDPESIEIRIEDFR